MYGSVRGSRVKLPLTYSAGKFQVWFAYERVVLILASLRKRYERYVLRWLRGYECCVLRFMIHQSLVPKNLIPTNQSLALNHKFSSHENKLNYHNTILIFDVYLIT